MCLSLRSWALDGGEVGGHGRHCLLVFAGRAELDDLRAVGVLAERLEADGLAAELLVAALHYAQVLDA